ncbi:16S rRNA (adenine(1518)-N(6)/adenine(1519)-N(6))-dimethyltransferase RsmA [Candidatus Parcubacteria bacterium]|nr:16S rRNA (adenine(1518)-N(6)/adenine(1519)-N(6))-dimethyltransferase RsmA [Candidatus Parcubacteria bacterium]
MYAKKSLGQHFLKSEKAFVSIIDAGEPSGGDLVLEIGPGLGDLTRRLLILSAKVIAVEKDDHLYDQLKEKFKKEIENNKLDLIHGDILDFDPNLLKFYSDFTYKLIANIPYNITGAILEKFLSADYQPERMVLLVQKEVAERIVARDGKPLDSARGKESILSISVKAYGKPRYVEKVLAGSFAPAPSVDSAIISIEDISKDFFDNFSEKDFFALLHAGFKSKRKKLSSNLSDYGKERVGETFSKLNLSDNTRAEDIHIETWQKLAESLLDR